MRNRSEPSQVTQGSFEPERIVVTPEGRRVRPCTSTVRVTLADSDNDRKPGQRKPSKGGQEEHARRGGHKVWAGPVKTFQNAGDVTNDTAGL